MVSVKDAPDPNNKSFTNSYLYDGLDRLRSATSSLTANFPNESYNFDSLGRMTTRTIGAPPAKTYVYGDAAHKDAPTAYDGDTYTYDAAGNQITHSNGVTTQQRSFDPENRLFRIVDGDSISEFVYDANGSRVLKSVSATGSRERTAYIGSLYEEELTGSANPPYINYYSLGGKMVGMRRANQPSMNGQYRMVTDHLGSASLLVDINGGPSGVPAVVQRQYFRAYGQAGYTWSSGGSLSDIGYTGQRTEGSTGLMFYGARFYDPQSSYFISADIVGIARGLSQSRNRYAYVLNNPVRLTDPSGHTADDAGQEGGADYEKNPKHYANILQKKYGIWLEDWYLWDPNELRLLIVAIEDLLRTAEWSPADFKRAMGIGETGYITLRQGVLDRSKGETGRTEAYIDPLTGEAYGVTITLDMELLRASGMAFLRDLRQTMVHELAHAWDFGSGGCDLTGCALSKGMMSVVGSTGGFWTGLPSDYAASAAGGPKMTWEMWAEAVTAEVYPDHPDYQRYKRSESGIRHPDLQGGTTMGDYIRYQMAGASTKRQNGLMVRPPWMR